jgi:hypothetical protein
MHADEHDGALERRIEIAAAGPDGRERRTTEHHVLRLYEVDTVVSKLASAGFAVEVRDGYDAPATFPGWKVFVAR